MIVFENKEYLLKRPGMKKWRPLLHYQWQIVPMLNPDGYSRSPISLVKLYCDDRVLVTIKINQIH